MTALPRLAPLAAALIGPLLAAAAAQAAACSADPAAVEAAIARLEPRYGAVLSDISCDAPTLPAQVLMCDAALGPDPLLWRMGRLDDLAWVYAVENATGQQIDLAAPPRDGDFIARRDACGDAACLCAQLIGHTNDSLGGESPYPQ
ncbi:hypothetical protein [Xinfangfangia pollutisoli]|uniref:hypothetical protein n=1 Tax=Xinfangfangia pollutisoli TaxID=2865960 RepID=UPI001CD43CA7|nr:hypothetical protein [Xinfangfangia pollutisoli]